jgi:hypothetical protein
MNKQHNYKLSLLRHAGTYAVTTDSAERRSGDIWEERLVREEVGGELAFAPRMGGSADVVWIAGEAIALCHWRLPWPLPLLFTCREDSLEMGGGGAGRA